MQGEEQALLRVLERFSSERGGLASADYGLPEWVNALQSTLLNESATLFGRKYYDNGNHAGFICT
jgi:capsid portal protein